MTLIQMKHDSNKNNALFGLASWLVSIKLISAFHTFLPSIVLYMSINMDQLAPVELVGPSQTRTKRQRLTRDQRIQIITLRDHACMTYEQIVTKLNILHKEQSRSNIESCSSKTLKVTQSAKYPCYSP